MAAASANASITSSDAIVSVQSVEEEEDYDDGEDEDNQQEEEERKDVMPEDSSSPPRPPHAVPRGRRRRRTVFHSVLSTGVPNGDRVLLARLDNCVSLTREEVDAPDCAVRVDLGPILEGEPNGKGGQADIVKDVLDFKDIRGALEILLHPVIQTFLEIKWRHIRKVFFVTFSTYLLFLLSYSLYLANIFYRQGSTRRRIKLSELILITGQEENSNGRSGAVEQNRIVFPDNSDIEVLEGNSQAGGGTYYTNYTNGHVAFESCLIDGEPSLTCFAEILLVFSLGIVVLQEALQLLALGPRRYLLEFENLLELVVFALAATGLALQQDMRALKWISAFGICLAYLELIFLMGRYPFLGGSISLMFYSILKHLFKSLSNFFVLIVGFGFGFFIMHHSKTTEHFENPWKAVAKTLTMALGEFDFDNLYDAHGSDAYSRMFTMVLMVGLAVMGSLILVNLIVAIIVSDIGELRRQAHLQETINKAQHVVFIESILPSLPSWCLRKAKKSEEEEGNCVFICPHNMCRCKARRLHRRLVCSLLEIAEARRSRGGRKLCQNCEAHLHQTLNAMLEKKRK